MHGSKHELFFWNMVDSLEKIPNKDFGIFSLRRTDHSTSLRHCIRDRSDSDVPQGNGLNLTLLDPAFHLEFSHK